MKKTLKNIPGEKLEQTLALIALTNRADTPEKLREIVVYGLGSIMESVSCWWTEMQVSLIGRQDPTTTLTLGHSDWDNGQEIESFNKHTAMHPVIARCIQGERNALSMSDCMSDTEFQKLTLYKEHYAPLAIKDQLSVGTVHNGTILGISVNRDTWGFSDDERLMLSYIGHCLFPVYFTLLAKETLQNTRQPVIEVNINAIANHHLALGVTQREAELLALVGYGKSNKQIAAIMGISEGTVRKHLENAFRRLNVTNRVSAIVKAIEITARLSIDR
ncbi:response regulator transcription factor [Bacterioplanoides sp.]|uniref:response regulator transcription factor n=1 Tax=Bacterioplanoides sp. TaxID=2066072 RepID=UPI003B0068E1